MGKGGDIEANVGVSAVVVVVVVVARAAAAAAAAAAGMCSPYEVE